MASSIPGKLLKITVNGAELRCQTNAVFTATVAVTANPVCKPSDAEITAGTTTPFTTSTADSKSWTITMSAQAFADSVAGSEYDILTLLATGDLNVQVQFLSSVTQTKFPLGFLITGSGILSSFTFNAPEAGSANYDITITGNGPYTFTKVPVTT